MADGGKEREMSFWDHLEELRGTLFRSIIALCIFAVLGFIFKTDVKEAGFESFDRNSGITIDIELDLIKIIRAFVDV